MRILWLTWKDRTHPRAGGAELVTSQFAARLRRAGHEVTILTAGNGREPTSVETECDGCRVIRVGNSISVYWRAYRYVRAHLADWPELVIEEVNTVPFFSRFYLRDTPRLMLFYMLCRQIWFFQLPPPLSLIGYVAEPVYLRLLNRAPAAVLGDSTRRDLARHGFDPRRITVFVPGIELPALRALDDAPKFAHPTLVSMGNIRPMKRTLHQLRAFESARDRIPDLELKIAGAANGRYGRRVLEAARRSRHAGAIEYLGQISDEEKRALLGRCHLILVTSIKEGWGLIVTEAASQGTPAAVYDVDGLRDSVRDGKTGVVTRPRPQALADAVVALLGDPARYLRVREDAWRWSRELTVDAGFADLERAIDDALGIA